ncbi:hypothetical protein C8R42DRAFT_682613 [Lentinula raphanica]|nr:hypothetical protein C8R42DRAFT_682613 [Lentinula raphanica]
MEIESGGYSYITDEQLENALRTLSLTQGQPISYQNIRLLQDKYSRPHCVLGQSEYLESRICFDGFVRVCIILAVLAERFRKMQPNRHGRVEFDFDEYAAGMTDSESLIFSL